MIVRVIVSLVGDACLFKVRFSLACVCVCADDGLLVFWIFHADAPGSSTGPFKPLFANARGYVLTGTSLLLLLC